MEISQVEILVAIGLFLLGMVCGGFLVSRPWNNLFKMQHSLRVIGQVDIARKLRSNKSEELLLQMETSLLEQAKALSEEFDITRETQLDALWVMREYFEKYTDGIPLEIQPILNNLASDPFDSKKCYRPTTVCSTDAKCLKNPTSLQPLTTIVDPHVGWKGTGKCGSKKSWFWRVPCGPPVTSKPCVY